MESRIASELLYESEATLRMVDTVLDELRISDAQPILGPRLAVALEEVGAESSDLNFPSELCVRAYWQVQELLDCVRHSREALQSLGGERRAGVDPEARCDLSGIDRTLALIDRLDTLVDDRADERNALHDELRQELLGMVDRAESESVTSERLSAVTLQLAEAEARLTRLGHLFDAES